MAVEEHVLARCVIAPSVASPKSGSTWGRLDHGQQYMVAFAARWKGGMQFLQVRALRCLVMR